MNEAEYDATYEISSWDDLDLNPKLLRGIFAYGFEKPSLIQQRAIKPIIMKKDVVAQAQSGTGKTATFTIGALANIDLTNNSTQVLVYRRQRS
jgi:translation initiation factor 4A